MGPAEVSCFSTGERERKSCEYFLFEPRGAGLNRVDWFESCSSFVKHTHTHAYTTPPPQAHTHTHTKTLPDPPCTNIVDFCCRGGAGDRDEKEAAL